MNPVDGGNPAALGSAEGAPETLLGTKLRGGFAALVLAALVAAPAQGAEGDTTFAAPGATEVSVSADGSRVAFVTALALTDDDKHAGDDVYVAAVNPDTPPVFTLITPDADGPSRGVELAAGGGVVAFVSAASTLVDGDTNAREDVFVANLDGGAISRVNVTSLGTQADSGTVPAVRPSLSADGSVIAFSDTARLTGEEPLSAGPFVFVRALPEGARFVTEGDAPSLSGDGKVVAFERDHQVYAEADGTIELVSRTPGGGEGDAPSGQPDVDADGGRIVFASEATNLGGGEDGPGRDVFLRARSAELNELVSRDDRGVPATGEFSRPAISPDGRYVAFLADRDPNGCLPGRRTVAVRDRGRESTFNAPRPPSGDLPDGPSGSEPAGGPSVGASVAYPSLAANLRDGDAPQTTDGFLTALGAVEDPSVVRAHPARAGEAEGALVFDLDVCRRAGRSELVELEWATRDDSATAGEDYEAAAGLLEVPAEDASARIEVKLEDDAVDEPWETLRLVRTGGPAAFWPVRPRGTIADDDLDADKGPIFFERGGSIVALEPNAEEPSVIADGRDPAVSRDGERLAFVVGREGDPDRLVVAAADGAGARLLHTAAGTGDGYGLSRPAWSPDGRYVAVAERTGNTEVPTADVLRIDVETGAVETLARSLTFFGETLSYAPDGARLAYDQGRDTESGFMRMVVTLDVDTGETVPLVPGVAPSFGPAGDIAFHRSDGLWILADGAAEPERFDPGGSSGDPTEYGDERPAWSPDGLALAFVRRDGTNSWIEMANVVGGPPARLTPLSSNDRAPAWGRATAGTPPPVPSVSVADASASEGDALSFTVGLSAPAATEVTVTATTSPGTAGSPGDFTAKSASVSIPAGQTQATFSVSTTEDALDEPDETLAVTLSAPSGATLGDATAGGTIVDDDAAPTVTIGDAGASEGDAVAFPVSLSAVSAKTATVQLTTTDGTATSPGDFTAQSNVLVTIPAGQTSVDVAVPTTEDSASEPGETFTAAIGQAVNATLGTPSTATGTIANDDAPAVSLRTPAAVEEGGTLQFGVRLNNPSATDVTVRLSTGAGSATAGSDYTARTNDAITIPAGQTEALFGVATKTDFTDEPDETVTVSINGATGATAGSPTSAVGTIQNVPVPRVSLGAGPQAAEGAGLLFPVKLSRVVGADVTVRLSTQGGSATASSDYTPRTNFEVVIPAGQTETALTVDTIDDALDEPDETVSVSINGATGAGAGSPTSAIGTIVDDDLPPPKVRVAAPPVATEGDALLVPVKLDRAPATDVKVRLSTADGSAKAPGDYTARVNAEITIPAGQTEGTFSVATVDDGLAETDETVKVSISGGTNVSAGSPTSTLGTITDRPFALVRGKVVGSRLVEGVVLVKPPRIDEFVDLGSGAGLPVGTVVDATEGTLDLVTPIVPRAGFARAAAATQRVRLSGGVFTIRQARAKALVTLVLSGKGCRRRLTADGKGAFAVKGRFATARIGSAKWTTQDACASTRVEVARGKVKVGRRTVRAGRSLTVRKRG